MKCLTVCECDSYGKREKKEVQIDQYKLEEERREMGKANKGKTQTELHDC